MTHKQLPIFTSLVKSESYTFKNLGFLVKISTPWLLLYLLFTLLFQMLGIGEYLALEQTVDYVSSNPVAAQKNGYADLSHLQFELETAANQLGSGVMIHYILNKLILAFACSSIAVMWFRGYLLGEKSTKFRFGGLEVKFLVYFTLFVAAYILIFWAIVYVFINSNWNNTKLGFVSIIVAILMVFLVVRFSLLFAGVSVGDKRMNPLSSWRFTTGNSLRIYGGMLLILLVSVPILIVETIITGLDLPIFIDWPIHVFLNVMIMAFVLSFSAVCYQFFVPRPEAGDLE